MRWYWWLVVGVIMIGGLALTVQRSRLGPLDSLKLAESAWTIPTGSDYPWRAVHLGVNCCGNPQGVRDLPEPYFAFLRDLGVEWVGVSVSLHLDDSLDATIEPDYGAEIPTYTDEELRGLVTRLHAHGFKAYLTLAFETQEAERSARPFRRFNLGDPRAAVDEPTIDPVDWPWDPSHPSHGTFAREFFASYADQLRHYGTLAEEAEVDLFSIGTETERLFQVVPSEKFPVAYNDEVQKLVSAARSVYSGLLTYDQLWPNPDDADYWALWDEVDFDVIGLSAYPPLVDEVPTRVLTVAELRPRWQARFDELRALKARVGDRPLVLTEFGYTRSVQAPAIPSANDLHEITATIDADGNGLDDGEEQQANLYESFFQTVEANPGLVQGAFSWGETFPEPGYIDEWGVRTKLAEDVMRRYYSVWRVGGRVQ